MAKKSIAAITVSATAIAILFSIAATSADETPKPPQSITVSELQQMQVIGRLGQPLGTIVTVEGVIADGSYTRLKADDGHTLLRIQSVNGKELAEEQVFQLRGVEKLKAGNKFKYIGYETGGFTGTPRGVFAYTLPIATTVYGFFTEFWDLRDELRQK